MNLPRDAWRSTVKEMVATALVTVLSGTPPQRYAARVNDGLAFELDVLGSDPGARLLVVRAPWRPDRLEQGWREFCAAALHYRVIAPVTGAWVQPRTHVLAYFGDGRWHAWGAHRPTDSTYLRCIDDAFVAAGQDSGRNWRRRPSDRLPENLSGEES